MQDSFDIGSAIDQGKRNYQQDSLGIREEGDNSLLIVLADGMGGHNGGDVASKQAIKAFGDYFKNNATEGNISNKLYHALHYANRKVCEIAKKNSAISDMGSTLIGLNLVNNTAYWISVGDSLLYRIRNNQLEKLNQEHSLINHFKKLYAAGKISRAELDAVKDPHAVTSSIGMEDLTEIDNPSSPIDLQFGDYLIIASDGLLTLNEQEIVNSVLSAKSAQKAADNLIDRVIFLNHPAQDNVSVIVIKVLGFQNNYLKAVPLNNENSTNRLGITVFGSIAVLVSGLLFAGYQFITEKKGTQSTLQPTINVPKTSTIKLKTENSTTFEVISDELETKGTTSSKSSYPLQPEGKSGNKKIAKRTTNKTKTSDKEVKDGKKSNQTTEIPAPSTLKPSKKDTSPKETPIPAVESDKDKTPKEKQIPTLIPSEEKKSQKIDPNKDGTGENNGNEKQTPLPSPIESPPPPIQQENGNRAEIEKLLLNENIKKLITNI